jgi:hypothetical protein
MVAYEREFAAGIGEQALRLVMHYFANGIDTELPSQ